MEETLLFSYPSSLFCCQDPSKRISLDELLSHSFMQMHATMTSDLSHRMTSDLSDRGMTSDLSDRGIASSFEHTLPLEPFNTQRLKPILHQTKNAIIRIDDHGRVILQSTKEAQVHTHTHSLSLSLSLSLSISPRLPLCVIWVCFCLCA